MTVRKGKSGKSKTSSASGTNARELKVRVKSARGRTTSSARWLERQLNDPYVAEAKRRGLRSRAAFKLIEMDDRFHFLRRGMRIVDLGCAPGGWCQVAAERVYSIGGAGFVVGVDLTPVEPIPGVTLILGDFLDDAVMDEVTAALGGAKADVVLSDMAAPATGHKQTDHIKIMALCEAAAEFAVANLAIGGTFCAKVLRGGTEQTLLVSLKQHFRTVRHVKPKASRADSAETYVLATEFRNAAAH
jgi:23S rRNA (uridine2552-2'-O)-methyltransferase